MNSFFGEKEEDGFFARQFKTAFQCKCDRWYIHNIYLWPMLSETNHPMNRKARQFGLLLSNDQFSNGWTGSKF